MKNQVPAQPQLLNLAIVLLQANTPDKLVQEYMGHWLTWTLHKYQGRGDKQEIGNVGFCIVQSLAVQVGLYAYLPNQLLLPSICSFPAVALQSFTVLQPSAIVTATRSWMFKQAVGMMMLNCLQESRQASPLSLRLSLKHIHRQEQLSATGSTSLLQHSYHPLAVVPHLLISQCMLVK